MTQEPHSQKPSSPKTSTDNPDSTDSPEKNNSSLQRQFSVVKRNAITLNALPQPLPQGKSNIAKSQKHSHSSKSPGMSRHKGEGEKKRRFSGSGRAKNKHEAKGKYVRTVEPCDQENTSWSPVHKRRAPESRLEDRAGDIVDNNLNVDAPIAMSQKNDSVSKEDEDKVEKNEEKLLHSKKKEEERILREDSMHEAPTENLLFSFKEELLKRATFKEELVKRATFKEELLKRATETKVKKMNDDDRVTNENKLLVNGYKQVSSEALQEKDKSKSDDDDDEGNIKLSSSSRNDVNCRVSNLVKDHERKHSEERKLSEDSSVKSGSTKGCQSRKGSVLDELEPPVAPKSVEKLREKFLNINDMIEEKHKTNLAKKSHEIQRELRCVTAWKQQTDSHVAISRKLSVSSAAKLADMRKPNIGANRRSVKELRKMYMGNGSSESKGSKEKLNLAQSRSVKATVNTERKSSGSETTEMPSQTSQGEPEKTSDSTEPETKEDSSVTPNGVDNVNDKGSSEANESCADTTDHMVIIHVDSSQQQVEDKVAKLSSEQTSSMSHETRTYTIIKSEDVPDDVPSLQIQPASPAPSDGERRSPGLKRHAASHDSGIDMPPYAQNSNNFPVSVLDDKISSESLKVAAEFSFPGSGNSVLTPSEHSPNEVGSDLQSPAAPVSPGSEFSPEVFWSLPLSVGSRASLTDTSSSCSSPRMSVIIAQEASTTKINSRYFTVETMEPWDFEDYRIAEEHQCVMEVEGEFCFGRERSRTSRAEREAIFSLHRDAKNHGLNAPDLIKEEEITLSPAEIDAELQDLEAKHGVLEKRGVEIEHSLRESMDCKYMTVYSFLRSTTLDAC